MVAEAEVNADILKNASYNLTIRGDCVADFIGIRMDRAGIQKKRLIMLCEGSVLPVANGHPFGDIVDVTPDNFLHSVYRFGRAYHESWQLHWNRPEL